MENERSYFARRAVEERSAAERSEDPKAREAHRQMAERYEEQALTADAPKLGAASRRRRLNPALSSGDLLA